MAIKVKRSGDFFFFTCSQRGTRQYPVAPVIVDDNDRLFTISSLCRRVLELEAELKAKEEDSDA